MQKIDRSEITPKEVFLNRRKFMIGAGSAAGALALAACSMPEAPATTSSGAASEPAAEAEVASASSDLMLDELPVALNNAEPFASVDVDELGDPLNTFEQITNYNNFYEFSLNKERVNPLSVDFNRYPWTVEVTGMVENPKSYTIEDLISNFEQEERIYRLRCVEAWSMVIPWVGFTLSSLLEDVQPTAEAQYVRMETVVRPEEMPNQKGRSLDWPYVEGLRLDEAMHPLTILATGMYGEPLTTPNGAPVRLVVPWKYGFKSIKSIVKIELTDTMPTSTWMDQASNEYGFYANVNPTVDHPRWSQATERRIGGGLGRRDTLMFNGYEEEVAYLYEGMDLSENY